MIEFKKLLSEEKERLGNIIGGSVLISKKYRGSKIFFIKEKNGLTFKKKGGNPITKTDLLITDVYFNPIQLLKAEADKFNEGKHILTYCAQTGVLYLDATQSGAELVNSDIISNKYCHTGELTGELKTMFNRGYNKKLLNHFEVDDSVDCLIVRGGDDDFFKITNPVKREGSTPNKDYCKAINDVITVVDPVDLKKILTSQTDEESVYMAIIDRLFLSYTSKATVNIESLDFGYPVGMKSERYLDKQYMMNPNVAANMLNNRNMFDLYVAMIASFRNDHMKWNDLKDDTISNKFKEFREVIKMVISNPILYSETPSYLEFIGDK